MRSSAKSLSFDRQNLPEAARIVKQGGLVVFPTDTVYGLGVDPTNASAVARLFAAKSREAKPIPVLCDGLASAGRVAKLDGAAIALARRYWPGALTMVVPMKASLPFEVHQGTGMVGVRVPDSELCLSLVRLCGGSLTGTSANVSGRPPCTSAREAEEELGAVVDLILDGGRADGIPSTVVKVSSGRIEVLREGPVRVNQKVIHP